MYITVYSKVEYKLGKTLIPAESNGYCCILTITYQIYNKIHVDILYS